MSRMSSIGTGQGARGARGLAALAVAVLLGAGWMFVRAGDGAHFDGGGGDTVGSLPLMSGPPPPESGGGSVQTIGIGPETPIASLIGPRQAVFASILDAQPLGPDGAYRVVELSGDDVRVEFYGRVQVLIDRAAILDGKVRSEILVGTTFLGGIAQVHVGGVLRAVGPLTFGATDFKLKSLDEGGVLTLGLDWHAISLDHRHRVLAVRAAAGVIELEQRD
jgi:hypothetical protein